MQPLTVLLIGLAIFRPDPKDPANSELGFGTKPGTTLHVKILAGDKFITRVDADASKLLSFKDDQGTDLSKQQGRGLGGRWLGPFPKIAEDGHSSIVKIRSKQMPNPKARQILLKANIALICGSGKKTERVENVALKADTTFKVGAMTVKIAKAGKPDWGDAQFSVQFSSKEDFGKIKQWEFMGPDGKKIEHHRRGSGSMGFTGNMTYTITYELQKKIDTVTLSLTYFNKLESVAVPINIRAGIGLGPVAAQATTAELLKQAPAEITAKPASKVTSVLTPSAKGQTEQLDPETARCQYHRKAARVMGTLNLPSEIIKELVLREKH